jgi:uncharacterized membrane protein
VCHADAARIMCRSLLKGDGMATSGTKAGKEGWFWHHTRHIRHRPRFSLSAAVFILLGGALYASGMPPARAVLLAFNIAALLFLVATAYMFAHSETAKMRSRARLQDEGQWGFLGSGIVVSLVVLVALVTELHGAKSDGLLGILLAAGSLLLSWMFMNTMFALHYAHMYYGARSAKEKGLDFPGVQDPDYWDFAYFAFVLGMTFQVSDVQINLQTMRRLALVHSIIAFFFNVIIIALTVNVVAGQA